MKERYRTRVIKDQLVFSAAHFITFAGNICERIHGHNYRVAVEVEGQLDENGYVFDFILLRDSAKALVDRLDHRMLLPTQHPTIRVTTEAGEATARFEERRWVFPQDECVLLPIANTTAELMARWMAHELVPVIQSAPGVHVDLLRVDVEENFGQWGQCELALASRS